MLTQPDRTEVDVEGLAAALETGVPLIDVREPDEFAQGHVPGAQLVPMGEIQARLHEIDETAPVYFICASGNRSGRVVDLLSKVGFTAINVAGGTQEWARSGRPLDVGARP